MSAATYSGLAPFLAFVVWLLIVATRSRVAFSPTATTVSGLLLGVSMLGDLRVAAQLALVAIATSGINRAECWILRLSSFGWFTAFSTLSATVGLTEWPLRLGLTSLALLVFVANVSPTKPTAARSSVGKGWVRPIALGVRYFSVATACLIVAGAVMSNSDGLDNRDRLQLPYRGLLYSSQDVAFDPRETEQFAGVHAIKRRVRTRSALFDILVVDGTNNRHAVHAPTICHAGDGWTLLSERTLDLGHGDARWVRSTRRGVTAECVYWFSDGEACSPSALWYWTTATLRRLTGGRSGQEPVLVVLTQATEQPVDWDRALAEFSVLRQL